VIRNRRKQKSLYLMAKCVYGARMLQTRLLSCETYGRTAVGPITSGAGEESARMLAEI